MAIQLATKVDTPNGNVNGRKRQLSPESSETSSKKVRNERQHGVGDDRSHDSDEDDCEDDYEDAVIDNVQGNRGARRVLYRNGSK